jgi:long-chain acyl-CoA synthetase
MINTLCQFPDLAMFNLNSLEVLAYGGSPIAPAVVRDARSLVPKVKLLQVYGLSEAGFLTGLTDAEHTDDRLQSCGRPCPGIDLRIVDAAGKPVASGELGNLVARGPSIMRGYWHDIEEDLPGDASSVEETTEALRGGFFHTGDIGRQDKDGYFYIVDRAKEMIVRRRLLSASSTERLQGAGFQTRASNRGDQLSLFSGNAGSLDAEPCVHLVSAR